MGTDSGETALHIACRAGWVESVGALVKAGCDEQAVDFRGDNALMMAAADGRDLVLQKLVAELVTPLPQQYNAHLIQTTQCSFWAHPQGPSLK